MIHKLSFTTEIGQIWLSLISIQQQKCILYSEIFFKIRFNFLDYNALGKLMIVKCMEWNEKFFYY